MFRKPPKTLLLSASDPLLETSVLRSSRFNNTIKFLDSRENLTLFSDGFPLFRNYFQKHKLPVPSIKVR